MLHISCFVFVNYPGYQAVDYNIPELTTDLSDYQASTIPYNGQPRALGTPLTEFYNPPTPNVYRWS